VLVAMLHDESEGLVEADGDGRPRIHYRLSPDDVRELQNGIAACARLLLAAGAREALVPTTEPLVMRTVDEAERLPRSRPYRPLDPPLTAVHPMGTLRMASDARAGATDGDGRFHGVRGLYVADGSLFPTSIGVPPQISIYTAGRRVARTIVADLGR
jgi:choline dehydrogenase-like flavoprotein